MTATTSAPTGRAPRDEPLQHAGAATTPASRRRDVGPALRDDAGPRDTTPAHRSGPTGACTIAADRDRTVVRVSGHLDPETATALRAQLVALLDAGVVDVVVDLTDTTFIDSTGVGVLLGFLKKVRRRGGDLQLVLREGKGLRLFLIAVFTRVFTIHRTGEWE